MGTKSNRSAGTQFTPRGVTQGNILVCPNTGNPIGSVVDSDGVTRLAVDASLTASNVSVSVDLDGKEDSVHIIDPVSCNAIKVNADGSIDSNTEVDAVDGDNIAISAHPDQIFDQNADTLTTLAFEQIFSYTSTDDDTRILNVEGTASTASTFRLKIDGTIIRVLRSSALEKNVEFIFKEHRPISNGSTVTVEAKVDRLIQTSYDTFVSLEGYLI